MAKRAKPSGKPGKWVDVQTAMKLTGLTRSGVEYAAKAGHIRRKKVNGTYRFSDVDAKAYRRGNGGRKRKANGATNGTPKPASNDQPAYMTDLARMKPKQAQTAVQKARWVFDGLSMGTISEGDALRHIRSAMYPEGSN